MTRTEAIKAKKSYGYEDLLEIMDILRGDNGCPWDREQTHESIRKNLIEETYEVCEAIDCDDSHLLEEELGDLLLQVVFHAKMASEDGLFDMSGVINGVCEKLIVRHPHIFGDVVAGTSDEVLKRWEDIKKASKKERVSAIDGIPPCLPALMRGQKTMKRSFENRNLNQSEISEKVCEYAENVQNKVKNNEKANEDIGKMLLEICKLSQSIGCDAEEELSFATDNYSKEFRKTEKIQK